MVADRPEIWVGDKEKCKTYAFNLAPNSLKRHHSQLASNMLVVEAVIPTRLMTPTFTLLGKHQKKELPNYIHPNLTFCLHFLSLKTPKSAMPTAPINLSPLPILLILLTHLKISNGYSDLVLHPLKSGEIGAIGTRVCDGNVGSCPASSEFEVDSEVNRRVLLGVQRKYISYETLKRDLVPCSVPGSSYYSCGASPEANRYSRGCSIITKCARF